MKKLNKFIAILVSLAMMATLCVITAFAENENTSGEAYFTKTWEAPEGVQTPAKDFTFTVTQDTTNGVNNPVTINGGTISFDANQTGTKSSANLLAGQDWKNAAGNIVPGKYVFTVKEVLPTEGQTVYTTTSTTDSATTTSKTTYDDTVYTMEVYVDNQGGTTVVVKDDEGKQTSTKPQTTGEDGLVTANGFNFRNTFSQSVTNVPTGSDPDEPGNKDGHSLYVEKEVTAQNASAIDNNQEFDFSTTVTFPAIDPAASYTATIVKADGTSAGKADIVFTRPATADENGKYTATMPYQLKNGERLVFTNIDLGATWTATETSLPDGYSYVSGAQESADIVTADKDGAKIVNNYDKGTTPTGILINNLPYIALALVAIGGLVAYVVVRRRDAEEA